MQNTENISREDIASDLLQYGAKNASDGIFLLDKEGKIIWANKKAYEKLDYTREEFLGKNILELDPHFSEKNWENHWEETKDKKELTIESHHIKKDGTQAPVELSINHLNHKNREIHLTFVRYISQRKQAEEKLKASQKNLHRTLQSIGDGVISTNLNGEITRINPVAENLTGWKKENAINKPLEKVFNIVNSETRKPVNNPVDKVLDEERTVGLANHTLLISKEGQEYQIADSASPIKDEKGNIIGVVLVFRDVTKKYEMRQKIAEREQQLSSLYESMTEGVCQHEIIYNDRGEAVNYRIIDINPAYKKILGIDDKDVVGKLATEVYQSDEPPFLETYAKVAKTGEPTRFDTYYPPRNKHFLINVFSSQKDKFITVFEDITERMRAQKEIQEKHRQLQTLFSNLPGITYRCKDDAAWTMEFVSKGTQELVGYTPEELIDNDEISFNELIHPDDREKVVQKVQDALGKEEHFEIEYRIITKNGKEKWVWERGTYIYPDQGPKKLEGFITDITARKAKKKELKKNKEKYKGWSRNK